MATTNFHKAIDIYTKNPPINQKSLGTLYEQLGREYYDQEYYQDALRYFKKALEIYQTSKEEESSFAVLYYHLGKAYYQNAEYEDALLYYDKCLHFESETISKSNLRSLSQTYHAIGEIFQTLNDYQMALTNYEKALETILKEDSLSVSSDNSNLTEKYQKDIQIVKAFL
jgi:tetratricopeptide (TPR) repeat protein